MKSLALLALSLLVSATAFAGRAAPSIVKFDECESQALKITLNEANRATKGEIVLALKAMAGFPDLVVIPVLETGAALHYVIRFDVYQCADQMSSARCADALGWTDLQELLVANPGVKLACADAATDLPRRASPVNGGQSDKADRADDGSVTIHN